MQDAEMFCRDVLNLPQPIPEGYLELHWTELVALNAPTAGGLGLTGNGLKLTPMK